MSYSKDSKQYTQPSVPQIKLKSLEANLFDSVASECANAISKTKPTQVRNFYDYVLKLINEVDDGKEFENILPFVKMLNSKVHYAKTRGHASSEFVNMIKQCVSQVDSKETLKTFKLFFEAVIGFSKK
ncbi:MAG: type III-A CRISPR-associated protein Csm2 [Campylobacteraceae bacterium]|jgi:CRISPR-associated protein Csm2|nr:type III-A CRISPR-associated protein Csm2 [Campylobacteraceae bacterium]